jgi:hypothetical protein
VELLELDLWPKILIFTLVSQSQEKIMPISKEVDPYPDREERLNGPTQLLELLLFQEIFLSTPAVISYFLPSIW